MITRILIILILLVGTSLSVFATHIRGGEITFQRVPNNQLAVRCTLNIYRDIGSPVIDQRNELFFGDGTSQESAYSLITPLPGKQTEIYTYYYEHTYSAFGPYTLYHYKNFRNSTVNNIGPNPDQVNFYVETQFLLLPQLDINGPNRSPRLDKPAVDLAKLGYKYFYDPAAYDLDGDSLSFEIIPSRTFFNNIGVSPINNYQLPQVYAGGRDSAGLGPASLTINSRTGLMTWDVPNRIGEYNVAIQINEWRNGFRIGYVVRDMQIIVKDVNNKPPYLTLPADTCIIARDSIRKDISAKDPDLEDLVSITANGGVFRLPPPSFPATFDFPRDNNGVPIPQRQPAIGKFFWKTTCEDVARQPYVVVFTAEDNKPRDIQLTDVKAWTIKVIGPKPIIRRATPIFKSIRVSWDPYVCSNIARFQIYRKEGPGPNFDTCQTGIPAGAGYTIVGTAQPRDTSFLDDNSGLGLPSGRIFCYRVVAIFQESKGGESQPSDERCARLKVTVPLITNVSVERTDSLNGEIFVRWTRPFELDTIQSPGPYSFTLWRTPAQGGARQAVFTTTNALDTTFTDRGIDTKGKLYSYQVSQVPVLNPLPINKDSSKPAQNINLQGRGTTKAVQLTWSAEVPWNNASGLRHVIYKYDSASAGFRVLDSLIGQATTTYIDSGTIIRFQGSDTLRYGRYYVLTRGQYDPEIFADTLENKSFEIQVALVDSTPPCPPIEVQIQNANLNCPSCEEYLAMELRANKLTWRAPQDTCRRDLASYNIYYKANPDLPFERIATTQDTFYIHQNNGSMAGCYRVSTVDRSGNESVVIDSVCNDNCVYFDLPNIFSPNGDAKNQKFTPLCASTDLIEDASLEVYNRWGVQVYSGGKEALADWQGQKKIDGSPLPVGTYFYRAHVRFKRLNKNDEYRDFKGWVEIVR